MYEYPPLRPFSLAEYKSRLDKTRKEMQSASLDLLFITEPENIYYLTNYQTVGCPDLQVLLVPREDDIYFITRKLEITNCERSLLVPSQQFTYADHEDPITVAIDTIKEQSPGVMNLAVERASKRYGVHHNEALKQHFTLSDSTIISQLRLIKSAAEIEVMTRAAQICAAGVSAAAASVPGMSESQIAGNIYRNMSREGAEYPAYPPFVAIGTNGCCGHYTGMNNTTLNEGNLLFVEIGGCFLRYHSAMMRTFYVGDELPDWLNEAEVAVRQATEEMTRAMRPGASCHDVDEIGRKIMTQRDWVPSLRSGYSIGIGFYSDWGESVSLRMNPQSEHFFQAGMVIHLIPWIQIPGVGAIGLSDTVAIGEDGAWSLFGPHRPPSSIQLIKPPPKFNGIIAGQVSRLLRTLQGVPTIRTPLVRCGQFASEHKLGEVYVKDESKRFNIQAFKAVGGLYACSKVLCKMLSINIENHLDVPTIRDMFTKRFGQTTFVTATDGNHGRGVAWSAQHLGQNAVIFMPKGTVQSRIDNVRKLGATVNVTDVNYDDTVALAFEFAKKNELPIVQDTALEGYTEIPDWIMQGYCAIVEEALEEMRGPTHVFLPCGVGCFASAVIAFLRDRFGDSVKVVLFEPMNAACAYESAKEGTLTAVTGDLETMMAGMACGVPSVTAWPILRDHVNYFTKICDNVGGNGMRIMRDAGIEAGECGGAGIGLLHHICTSNDEFRAELGLDERSHILLINTEGATDPENYQKQMELPMVPGSCDYMVNRTRKMKAFDRKSSPPSSTTASVLNG